MNILILSAGTRCQLVQYFFNRENGFDKVVTTDCSIYAPAIYMSDAHYIVPEINAKDYFDDLIDICQKEDIHVILPLYEDELELISEKKKLFENRDIMVAVSEIEAVRNCRDKYLCFKRLSDYGIACVDTYNLESQLEIIQQMELPVLVKEQRGAGSIGMMKINTRSMLLEIASQKEIPLIVQPYLEAEEYGVDVYVDFLSRKVVSIFAKRKIRMRAGETEKSISIVDEKLFDLVKETVQVMDLRGPIDIDVFKHNGKYYILEINPRFGGGYPHAQECGINFVRLLCENAKGKENIPVTYGYKENQVYLKYTNGMLLNEKNQVYGEKSK